MSIVKTISKWYNFGITYGTKMVRIMYLHDPAQRLLALPVAGPSVLDGDGRRSLLLDAPYRVPCASTAKHGLNASGGLQRAHSQHIPYWRYSTQFSAHPIK
jgi:hypothetical protein